MPELVQACSTFIYTFSNTPYAYNLSEQRWAYGDQPKNHLYLEKFLNSNLVERPVGTLASRPN